MSNKLTRVCCIASVCCALLSVLCCLHGWAQTPSEDEACVDAVIRVLRAERPTRGDVRARRDAILALDRVMCRPGAPENPAIGRFYSSMMMYALEEIAQPVTDGTQVWAMYNHGFVVRAGDCTVAFDLIDGFWRWDYQLPDWLIDDIDVLFISHTHGDHLSKRVVGAMTARGKPVIVPSENADQGSVGLDHWGETSIGGIRVRAFSVVHGEDPCRLYEVTLPNGARVVHTGDMGTSESLPPIEPPDALLLNCWVNEVGTRPDWFGVSKCVERLEPKVTILSHAQEMGHEYDLSTVTTRRPYEWSLQTQDRLGADRVKVMMWGEQYVLEGRNAGGGSAASRPG